MIDAGTRQSATTDLGVVRLRIHDLDLEVRTDTPAVLDAVTTSYSAFLADDVAPSSTGTGARANAEWVVTRRSDDGWELSHGRGETVGTAHETGAVLGTLDRIVMSVIGGLGERGIIGTHAGALCINGRAVVLAGKSGAGKSTLTLALLRNGASFLTDELTLIGPDDRTVLPYPRALHVSPSTVELVPEFRFLQTRPRQDLGGGSEWSVSTADLDRAFGSVVAGPTPLGAIVLLDERGDAIEAPSISPVTGAETAIALLRGTPAAGDDFSGTLARLAAIAGSVPTLRLRATELSWTAAVLRDHLAALP